MAAAFAALVSLQNSLLVIYNHPRHSFSFEEKQIRPLWLRVCFLVDFMASYNNSHGARKEAAQALEMQIARAAQAAEDAIESHVVDQIHSGKTRSNTTSSRFLLDLQKVIQGVDYIMRKALNVTSRRGMEAQQQQQPTHSAAAATSSTHLTSTMVGFDDVLLKLLHLLTGVPSSCEVIPIVGMGGIGKTTLATNVFQHSLIVDHFDVRLWATVSQEYSIQKILAELLSQLGKSSSGTVDEQRERLRKSLYGGRYLIILDDMWSLKAWEDMQFLFPDTNNGSRVVVTTRHSNVGKQLGASFVGMNFLHEDNSWHLFCQKAFPEQCCPPELEEIGRKIVEKCRGLPLAIVVIGGHLGSSPRALDYWENVALHMNSILSSAGNDEQCMNVLSMSYSYLPVHLKPCFLLIGAFPEDEKIYAWDVLKLWISEGFIQYFEDSSMEEAAEYYLRDLCMRNLILVVQADYKGKILIVKVHDLVRELCLKIAKKEEFLSVFKTQRAINRECRVAISGDANHGTISFDAPIRCLICEGGRYRINNLYDLKLLRTLSRAYMASTSESIFQQVNLRYLNLELDHTTLRTLYYLPSSISLLWNLQILTIIIPDQSTLIAPYEIWEMLQLRHLEVDPICLIDPLPVDRSDQANHLVMRNLNTLFKVKNFRLSEEVCKRIPNVRELRLSYYDEASSYYCPRNLGYFHQLENLSLQFDFNSKWCDFAKSLTFPSSLKVLRLIGCGVDWEELSMMVGSLPHLEILSLLPNSVIGPEWNPIEGEFLSLKYLAIYGCDDLVNWNADSCHFPVLKNLHLRNLSKLDEFPSGIGEIPTLEHVDLRFCSATSTISAMRTLVEQEEQGNESIRLNVFLRGDEETLQSFNNKVQEEGLTSSNLSLHLQSF